MYFKVTSFYISSVIQSCPTLCDPINHGMPGLPVHHHLPPPFPSPVSNSSVYSFDTSCVPAVVTRFCTVKMKNVLFFVFASYVSYYQGPAPVDPGISKGRWLRWSGYDRIKNIKSDQIIIAQWENSVEKRGWITWFTWKANKIPRWGIRITYVGCRCPPVLPKEREH